MDSVRSELLSGTREESSFKKLPDPLRAFEHVPSMSPIHEESARLNNRCRARGISGSAIDFLICATAIRPSWQIFTMRCPPRYAAVLPLKL